MNVQFLHAPVHTPEQAREIVREALAIADELADDLVPAADVFREAVRLLGARASATLMEQQPFALPPHMAIPKGRP